MKDDSTLSRFELATTLDTIEKLTSRALNEANAEIHDILHAITLLAETTGQKIRSAEKIEID